MKLEKDKKFGDYFNEIKNSAGNLKNHPDELIQKIGQNIIESTDGLSKGLEGQKLIMFVLFFLTIAMSILTFIFAYNYQDLREKFSGKTFSIFGLEQPDSVTYYVHKNGKAISYAELIKINDSLTNENNKLSSDKDSIKFLLDYAVESYGISFKREKRNAKEFWDIQSNTVNKLLNLAKSANDNTRESNKLFKKQQDLIDKKLDK